MIKKTQKNRIFSKIICFFAAFSFLTTAVLPPSYAQSILSLPQVGSMVTPGPAFAPPVLRGMRLHSDNPFLFDFIIDTGQGAVNGQELKDESARLIKYFLASLTVPEKDLWVNLSPYEENRIIPQAFGITEMGRDLLAQDYILKQLTASLMYPEDEAGKEFWEKARREFAAKTGISNIPMDTFNKVWIVPDHAQVYVNEQTVFVVESHLKVMLETDYLAMKDAQEKGSVNDTRDGQEEIKQALREVVLPIIEKEVNEGENFAQLRQIYHSMILSTWFKRNLKKSLLGDIYMGKNKVSGVEVDDKQIKDKIYQQYLEAFKKGVFNYIKEEYDPASQQVIPRKYFSGGFWGFDGAADNALLSTDVSDEQMSDAAQTVPVGPLVVASAGMNPVKADVSMSAGGVWVDGVRQKGTLPFELTPQENAYVRLLRRDGVNVVFYTDHDQWQEYLRDHGYDSIVDGISLAGRPGKKDQVLVYKGKQQKTPLYVVLAHEAIHVKQKRAGNYEVSYYRLRDALWDMQDEGDKRGRDLFNQITYQLQYRHVDRNRILNDWQTGVISREEAIGRIQKRYGEQDQEFLGWVRTASKKEIFGEYGSEVEEIADEFFSYVYSRLIRAPDRRKSSQKKGPTEQLHRLLAEFVEHIEGTQALRMLEDYYKGLGMPAPIQMRDSLKQPATSRDVSMLSLSEEDIHRLAPVEGDELFIRNESGMPLPYEVLNVEQDAQNSYIFHLTLLDPVTGQDVDRDYDLAEELSQLKLVNGRVLEGFEFIETPVAGVAWKQYTNRIYKMLSDKNHPDVSEDQKWRLYLRPGSAGAMESLVEAVKETAQGFNGAVEFKYLSENEPSLEEKLADPHASSFVINFASQQDAMAFYEALKSHPLYNVAMGTGETLAAQRLDALTSIAQGHTAARTGDASVLSEGEPVGGIDLTPDQMFLQETGESIDVDSSLDPALIEQLRGVEIEGLAPVIFNIQPINNIPLFFSADKDQQPQQLAAHQV